MKIETFVVVALTICTIAAGMYIYEHGPTIQCFNWFGLVKSCSAIAK